MQLIRRESFATITAVATDGSGAQIEPDEAKVTITRDSDGEVIASEQSATVEGALLSYEVAAEDVPRVDLLRVEWEIAMGGKTAAIVHEVGVVGAFVCSLSEIRDAIGNATDAEISDAALAVARAKAEALLEGRCNVAFRPSYMRERRRGDGTDELFVSRPRLLSVRSASIGGQAISLGELAPSISGTITRTTPWPEGVEVEVVYEHGYPAPPDDVREAAIKLARDYAIADPSNYDQRAGRIETAEAVYGFLTTAGAGGAETSIPEVNAVIQAYRHPVIA